MAKKHKHHIIPKHMGGSDDKTNLVELTIEEHAQAHLDLYEKHGKMQDYTAYRLLAGLGERHEETSRLGGHIQGRRNAENGHMVRIRKLVNPEHLANRVREGMFKFRNNCFLDPEKHRICAVKGGKVQGRINVESGRLAEMSRATAKQRADKMRGKIFINNGITSKLIHESEIENYPGWMRGRKKKV